MGAVKVVTSGSEERTHDADLCLHCSRQHHWEHRRTGVIRGCTVEPGGRWPKVKYRKCQKKRKMLSSNNKTSFQLIAKWPFLYRSFNGNTNFNGIGNFGNFNDLFTNQNINTWYALLGALLIVPLFLALIAGGSGGLGGLFGNRRQSFLNRVAQGSGNVNNRPQTFVPTVGESLLLAYIQSANDLYGPMLQG